MLSCTTPMHRNIQAFLSAKVIHSPPTPPPFYRKISFRQSVLHDCWKMGTFGMNEPLLYVSLPKLHAYVAETLFRCRGVLTRGPKGWNSCHTISVICIITQYTCTFPNAVFFQIDHSWCPSLLLSRILILTMICIRVVFLDLTNSQRNQKRFIHWLLIMPKLQYSWRSCIQIHNLCWILHTSGARWVST